MRFQDIAALTEQTPKVQGFVVNPFGENLPFTQEMLESIKQTLIKVAKERKEAREAAEKGEAPDIAVTNNENSRVRYLSISEDELCSSSFFTCL